MGEPSAEGIRIRLFAGLREQAGWSEHHWPAPAAHPHPTPRQLWLALQLPGELSSVRVAINHEFTTADTPLHDGDELAFLPPISGG
ncbi:MAG: MoaD/ThiS family protein [Synechococcaceae bacterium WB8_1B_136]|nr:MoaD/ThiS family protein [Synechococcaceae bacterium WB8_1B_136]